MYNNNNNNNRNFTKSNKFANNYFHKLSRLITLSWLDVPTVKYSI
jgi:hypothetical protein